MKIAIIGAGHTGMAAAYDLSRQGHQVTIFEASDHVGGLASGFKQSQWQWSLEYFYHHWFASDAHMLRLFEDLGLRDQVEFHQPKTVAYYQGSFYQLDTIPAIFKFPAFNLLDIFRFGAVTTYLKFLARYQTLEKSTAHSWLKRWYGKKLYQTIWQPLLKGKFGPYYQQVNMAWMWARLKARTPSLGTFKGGFQAFNDQFAQKLKQNQVEIRLNTPVFQVKSLKSGKLSLKLNQGKERFDRCLITLSPHQAASLVPGLPPSYLKGLKRLEHLSAIVVVLSLKQPFSPQKYYWYNVPKSEGFPFLAVVEHTNFVSSDHFGGDTLVYCGDYLSSNDPLLQKPDKEIVDLYLQSLPRINPQFQPSWVKKSWVFRAPYAQPVPKKNHSRHIPTITTPVPGVYLASMSQVYPWDRGTNFAVGLGREAAALIDRSRT